MTKLQELRATLYAAEAVLDAANADYDVALAAYCKELEKRSKAPREPVEDEGNPLT